jgi:hypothetical protein
VHRADEQPQRVHRGHPDAGEGDAADDQLGVEDADQDEELAGEVRRARHGQVRERDDEEERGQQGRAERQAAHVAQVLAAARALGEVGDDDERGGHDQAVVDRLQDRALGAVAAQREDPEDDEAELRDGRVPEDQARAGRRERHRRPVEDRGERQHQHQVLEVRAGVGEDRRDDAQEAVGGDLGEHRREHGEHRQRHVAVAVGHPAVERERRHLHEERRGEAEEDPLLRALAQRVGRQVAEREAQVVAALLGDQDARGDRRGQHQQRPDQGVDEQLGDRRDARALRPPDPRQEQERQQHQVEEQDEERQVLGHQRAEHGALGQAEEEEELPRRAPLSPRRPHDAHQEDERREHDEEEVQPIDAQLVVDAERLDPHLVGGVLQPLGAPVEVDERPDRPRERAEGAEDRQRAGRGAGQEQPDQRGGRRQPEGDGERKAHEDWIRKYRMTAPAPTIRSAA